MTSVGSAIPDPTLDSLRQAVAEDPGDATAWRRLGQALSRQGQPGPAAEALERAEAISPTDPAIQSALAAAYRADGRTPQAIAADYAALALQSRSALALYNLATTFFQSGQNEPAAKWYRLALVLDPDLVLANQNLAAILEVEGRKSEARQYRERALRRQCLFVEPVAAAKRTVLILAASAFGNVPIEYLIPAASTSRIKWFVEFATPGQENELPPHDVVFNAIGDADLAEPLLPRLLHFADHCPRPLLNRPDAVARTQRHRIPDLLAGLDDVVVPPAIRLAGADLAIDGLAERLAAAALPFPLLIRPIGSHGGKDVVLIDDAGQLAALPPIEADACYFTGYHDYRAADGFYRKYRMIYVDRQAFPYHMAISPHWLVHYFSADMLAAPWKREEERRFLADPVAVLGTRACAAIAAIGRRLDLDFAGIDFTVLPDGRVLVFEANATMLVHLHDPIEDFPYKHEHVPKIFQAFDAMLDRRSRRGA
jgi:hypothetical protein